MNTKLEAIFFVVAIILALVYGVWMINTEKRLKRFFRGAKGKDLEDTIESLQDEVRKLKQAQGATEKDLLTANAKLRKSIRGVETIRFNPFSDQGSNQSFAIGMLDEEGDGVVISSLYARDRMSVFAKPVKNKKSEYELSKEERQALDKAEVK